jgi:hypothetical protein
MQSKHELGGTFVFSLVVRNIQLTMDNAGDRHGFLSFTTVGGQSEWIENEQNWKWSGMTPQAWSSRMPDSYPIEGVPSSAELASDSQPDAIEAVPSPEPAGVENGFDAQSYALAGDGAGHDDVHAALAAITPADTNMDLMLDYLTTSNDLFDSPHLDLSALAGAAGDGGHS